MIRFAPLILVCAACSTSEPIAPDPARASSSSTSAGAAVTASQAIALTPAPFVAASGETSIATFALTLVAGDVVFIDLSMMAGLPAGASLSHADLQLVVDGTPQTSGHVTVHDVGVTGTCATSYVASSAGLHAFAVNAYAIAASDVTFSELNVRALVLSPR